MVSLYARVKRLEDIDLNALAQAGIGGLILDLDNTLLAYGSDHLPEPRRSWIAEAQKRGFGLVIVSNNFPQRVNRLGAILGIPSIPNALKPLPFAFWRALTLLDLPRHRCLIIGDQLLTDLLGAGCLGVRGILTEPIVARDFPITRILRCIERRLLKR